MSYSEICQNQSTNNDFLFNALDVQEFVGYCNALKGSIVIPTDTIELDAFFNTLINRYTDIVSENLYFWTDLNAIG